jgi:hypothetical protein
MGKTVMVVQTHEHHCYFEVTKGAVVDGKLLKKLKLSLEKQCLQTKKKALICLPSNFEFRTSQYPGFFRFLHKHMEGSVIFSPHKEFLPWAAGWGEIFLENFPAVELGKSNCWLQGQQPPGTAHVSSLGTTVYVKLNGAIHDNVGTMRKAIEESLGLCQLPGKLLKNPVPLTGQDSITWSLLQGGLVIDLGEVLYLNRIVLSALCEVLQNHSLSLASPGIYCITSGFFQNWLLAQATEHRFNSSGNIIRVTAEKRGLDSQMLEKEALSIAHACQEQSSTIVLFTHHVAGAVKANQIVARFFPDIVITDEISAANALQSSLPALLQEKIYYVTPAADPRVRIVSSQIITQGYDVKLFAEYLVCSYHNNREKPNDTRMYYLDAHPESLKKVTTLLLVDFAHILNESHHKLLQSLLQCETQANEQGSFLISLLDEKILNLKIALPFTTSGGCQFMSHYGEFFPDHFSILCEPLRLFVKGDSGAKTIFGKMHVIQDFTEIAVQGSGVQIEARLQPQQTRLTFQARQQEGLEKQSLALVSILNGSDIFNKVADKEVLIELVSLLWENSKKNSLHESEQGQFVLTLQASLENTEIKIVQSTRNKILLKQVQQSDHVEIHLIGDTPHTPEAQKRLLKIISMFFMQNPQDQSENTWKFAVFEALSQVAARSVGGQVISFDFKIAGAEKVAVLIASGNDKVDIAPRARKTLDAGADRVIISANGRQVTLIKNPASQQETVPTEATTLLQQELESLQQTKILQEVENSKAKDTAVSNEKLRAIYEQALDSYNKKYGDVPENKLHKTAPKTLEEAAQTKMVRTATLKSKEMARRINRVLWPTLLGLALIASGITWHLFHKTIPPGKSTLVLEEVDNRPQTVTSAVAKPIARQEVVPVDPADPAMDLIKDAIHTFSGQAPSQDQLNNLLRQLYLQKEKMATSGDFHNLLGRLFWYKIYLDRNDKIYKKTWVMRWRDEAAKAWETARRQYTNKQEPTLQMPVLQWMPEKQISGERQDTLLIIRYKTSKEAVGDMDRLLQVVVAEIDHLIQNW